MPDIPKRQVRADFDETSLTVYQAYSPEIADPTLAASLTDVTELATRVHAAVRAGELETAQAMLPLERPYPLPPEAALAVSASASP